jgi:2-polyprenyl-3-methyl-5-hydroxy-6-metoxy-1,4-benzoquinol methylase
MLDPYQYLPTQEYGNIQASLAYFLRWPIPQTAQILDVGAHRGSFIHELTAHGYMQVYGVDINSEPIEYGQRHYPYLADRLQVYDGFQIPFPDESFEVVTLFDVLEHLTQPHRQLGELRRVLRPGGRLIFQTPNLLTNVPWEIIQRRSLTYWRTYHCSLQTLPSLRRLLREVGFEGIQVEKYNLLTPYNLAKVRRVFGGLGPPLLQSAARLPLLVYPNFWGSCQR